MPAVVSIVAGGLSGLVVGLLASHRMRWRPSRQMWLLLAGGSTIGIAYEVWFIFGYLRLDEGVRTNPAPVGFLFVWTLALAACGVGASALRAKSGRNAPPP